MSEAGSGVEVSGKIIIAGAGIGGLTTALCLSQHGLCVDIYEKSAGSTEQGPETGAGIQLGANAVNVLQSLNLTASLSNLVVQPEQITFRQFDSGNDIYQSLLGQSYQSKFGAPYWHIHRADLYQSLVAAVRKEQNCNLHFNYELTEFRNYSDSVEVSFNNGESRRAELLIAADGINSTVRKQLDEKNAPRWTGHTAWRAVVDRSLLPDDFMPLEVSNFVGSNKHAVIYYLRNEKLVNFVGVVPRKKPHQSSWVSTAPWQELQQDFDGWHETVQQVIAVMDKQKCYQWDLYDHNPLSNWNQGRVTLLGDAAHATLPFMASGAAMAIEDARVLQRCLSESTDGDAIDVIKALATYQANRQQRTNRVQRQSRQLGNVYKLPKALRSIIFKGLALRANSGISNADQWLPAYDPNTVKLRY